jgi:hypothetical protein
LCSISFSVLEHQAQYAVRRRVLRSEIDNEVAQRSLAHGGPPFGAPRHVLKTWHIMSRRPED